MTCDRARELEAELRRVNDEYDEYRCNALEKIMELQAEIKRMKEGR